METLLESLDESVFTAELKEGLISQFNEAVKAKEEEMSSAFDSKLEEAVKEKEEALVEAYEAKFDAFKEEVSESVDTYMDRIIDEFLKESEDRLKNSLKSEKADMVLEAFDALLVSTGVDIAKITDKKESNSLEAKLAESIEKYDALMNEHLELQKEKEEILKESIILEMKEGLSLVEAKKFDDLAKVVEFSNDDKFAEKLTVIKESVKGTVEKVEDKEDKKDIVNENKDNKISYSHLI